jgi:hypothetical protein
MRDGILTAWIPVVINASRRLALIYAQGKIVECGVTFCEDSFI